MMKLLLDKYKKFLGPGIMYAAAAVGVSHLVQATRAGGEYGLSLVWVFVVISLVKFPGFFLACRFATITSRPVGDAYLEMGTSTTVIMIISILADFFISMAVVALVTAGLIIAVTGIPLGVNTVAVLIMVASAALLYTGRYNRFETIITFLVLIFTLLIMTVAASALFELPNNNIDLLPAIENSTTALFFVIAVAAWMPTPLSVSFYISAWTVEKQKVNPVSSTTNPKDADQEFIIGYGLTIFLALCFIVIGTAFLFVPGEAPADTSVAFAAQIIRLFTESIGMWGWGIISAAAIGVMISTVVSLMDGTCRSLEYTMKSLFGDKATYFPVLLIVQIIGAAIILYVFASSFTLFIDIATSTAFVSAPLVAYFNYKALKMEGISVKYRPSYLMTYWTGIAVIVLTGTLAFYFYTLLY